MDKNIKIAATDKADFKAVVGISSVRNQPNKRRQQRSVPYRCFHANDRFAPKAVIARP